MPCRWSLVGKEVPEGGFDSSRGSQKTTFVLWSPLRNASNPVNTEVVLFPSRWGLGGQEVPDRFLMVPGDLMGPN